MIEDTVILSQEIKRAEDKGVVVNYYSMEGEDLSLNMCPGDLICICNVLYDYARIFEAYIKESEERGLYGEKYIYEYHLKRCKEIQEKIETALGYGTEKAIEKCRKKQGKPKQDDDVGEDALVLTLRKMRKKQEN